LWLLLFAEQQGWWNVDELAVLPQDNTIVSDEGHVAKSVQYVGHNHLTRREDVSENFTLEVWSTDELPKDVSPTAAAASTTAAAASATAAAALATATTPKKTVPVASSTNLTPTVTTPNATSSDDELTPST